MPHIDLNCDLGESFGAYTIGMDEKVIPFITSANVACGFHAGDPLVMQRTVALCKQSGAAVGAHPAGPLIFLNFIHRQLLDPAEASGVVLRQRYAVILKPVHQVVDIVLHAVPPFSDTSWYGPSRSRKTFSFSRPRRSLDLTVDSLSPISREMSPILWQ